MFSKDIYDYFKRFEIGININTEVPWRHKQKRKANKIFSVGELSLVGTFSQIVQIRKQNLTCYSPFILAIISSYCLVQRNQSHNLSYLYSSLFYPYLSIFSYKVTHIFFLPFHSFTLGPSPNSWILTKAFKQLLYLHFLFTPVYLQHSQHDNLPYTLS